VCTRVLCALASPLRSTHLHPGRRLGCLSSIRHTSVTQCHGEYHRSNVTQSQSLIVASFSPIHISDSEWLIAGYRSDFCSKTSNNLYVSFSAGWERCYSTLSETTDDGPAAREWPRVRELGSWLPAAMARLSCLLLLLALFVSSVGGLRRSEFPPSFLFGAGTSSYQVRRRRRRAHQLDTHAYACRRQSLLHLFPD